ncbi:hypothetical protein ABEB36_000711 [Hypothenemus hampei]|uniref:Dynein axonemal intermediate chain 4 n=1 Tax=Hypothenemus hampei TaxID=57062 RepID=A0ABD1FFR2_HYPHA
MDGDNTTFSVKHNECVGFESKWKVTKVSMESGSQTSEFTTAEQGCDAIEHKSQDIQTEPEVKKNEDAVDMEKLAKWLSALYPKVKEQIENANSSSKIFKNYRLIDETIDTTCKLVQSVQITKTNNEETKAVPIIASLKWNNVGNCLAVPHNYQHKTWCYHTGVVSIYSLQRDDTLSETVKKRLTTESCVTTVSFHPLHRGVLAAGTFTGHIYLWNIENDLDPLMNNIEAHNEYITQISWIQDVDSTKNFMHLASASTDGFIKIWSFNLADNLLQIKTVYKIKSPVLARINKSVEVSKTVFDRGDLGILGFDFSKHIPDIFLVAMEGGLVVRCSTLGVIKIKGLVNSVSTYDPVFKYYEPHKGEIVSIQCSPHRKDMFLTSSTDGEIRIYLLDQDDPAQVIFSKSPLNDVSFVLNEEKLLAGCGTNGILEIFHLIKGDKIALKFDAKITKKNLTSLAINSTRENLMVLGTSNGEVQLWNIPWHYIEFTYQKPVN